MVNYTALKSEIETDPAALGYPSLAVTANDPAIADILNNLNGDKGNDFYRAS